MALEIIRKINVDFYDKRYIMVNAKQYDDRSRYIAVACYNQGNLIKLNSTEQSVYVKYKKADGNSVLNFCRINSSGEAMVELTEQMLSADGICYVDLMIVNKGNVMVDIDTGEITVIDGSSILSTMAFCVNVYESSVDNSEFESLPECTSLNDLLKNAEANYSEVIRLAKSYAIGDAGGTRDNEDYDNSKYYYEMSLASADAAKEVENNVKMNEDMSKSYAIGGTGVRENEDTDNAKYYCGVVKNVVDGLNSGFIPMGTIMFSDLATVEKATGFTYNIKDDFVTTDDFAEGAGMMYTAGTNVYFTASGKWDCFGGSASSAATVDEVKNYLGI